MGLIVCASGFSEQEILLQAEDETTWEVFLCRTKGVAAQNLENTG